MVLTNKISPNSLLLFGLVTSSMKLISHCLKLNLSQGDRDKLEGETTLKKMWLLKLKLLIVTLELVFRLGSFLIGIWILEFLNAPYYLFSYFSICVFFSSVCIFKIFSNISNQKLNGLNCIYLLVVKSTATFLGTVWPTNSLAKLY